MDEKMLLQAIQQIVKTEIEPLNGRMDEMSGRMDEMSSRIDRMENRMDRIESGWIAWRGGWIGSRFCWNMRFRSSCNCWPRAIRELWRVCQGTRNGGSSLPSEYAGAGIGGSQ